MVFRIIRAYLVAGSQFSGIEPVLLDELPEGHFRLHSLRRFFSPEMSISASLLQVEWNDTLGRFYCMVDEEKNDQPDEHSPYLFVKHVEGHGLQDISGDDVLGVAHALLSYVADNGISCRNAMLTSVTSSFRKKASTSS